ncbi:amino acid adenylation domain-containing protein [Streptosporangium sp. NPDC087985]|uniref:non-ribosomal peptide synthetase n=1 Tax=Streptosporangium sp. NPDC087985 TaxID=3366196 RepID=UPI0037F5580D
MVTTLELIRRWLELTPEAVAVSGTESELTYRELHRRVDDLAAVLREWGVGPEVPVGLCMERTPGMVVAVLAVWAAGGAYVPLDPAFPEDRLRLMREDARIELVVTQSGVDPGLLRGVPRVLSIAQDGTVPIARRNRTRRTPGPETTLDHGAGLGHEAAPAGLATRPIPASGPAAELAYLIYTSGSTGRPKGVAVPQRAVANLLGSFSRRLELTPEDSWLAVTTLSFDISVLELLLPLVSGARVVVASAREAADGRELRDLAAAEGITVMQATPATWRILLEAGGVPETVRTRLCGGEALPRDLADALLGADVDLWNVYGPTETTVWSTAGMVRPGPSAVDLGEAIDETSLYLLDEGGNPVADGEVGELHIGGTGVARGYHGMAAQTAARFLPDPFTDRPGARMYATDDLARITAEGRLEYLGRADQQVKIRGFRIELGEIETVLRSAEEVRHAAVGVCDGPDGLPRLVAYVVPTAGPGDLWPALRERLRLSLPDYMVPAHLVTVDALPLTPNGKLDRRALPPPRWTATRTVPYRAPSTPVEDELTVMWAEVLGVEEPVGVDDDFFELGGHSLTAARIIARVQARFGAAMPIVALFEHPTVAGLALQVDSLGDDDLDLAEVAALREQLDGLSSEDLAAIFDGLAPGA